MAITLKAYNGYNERFAPSGAKKAYIARITGRDSKMTFAREFLGHGDVMVDDAGLYEVRTTDKKGRADDEYILLLDCPAFPAKDGDTIRSFIASREEAMKLAKAMESRTIDAIAEVVDATSEKRAERTWAFVTPKQAEKAAVAQTIDSATNACWSILQALPEKEAKKVLAALKARVSPKLPATVEPLLPETPCGIVNDYAQTNGSVAGQDSTPIKE